jgi:aminoglycoside 3-N-acetyltransferase
MADFPESLKRRLKPALRRGRRGLARALRGYDSADLHAQLLALGIRPRDTIMLHSGFAGDSGFGGTPADVIDAIGQAIGADGNLVMMSSSYRGSAEAWAASAPLFDVLKTPSAMGLISETFRRMDGVHRSLSPLHPVLARGPLAAWIVADHQHLAYSCGPGSPFERVLNLEAKILFYDAPYRAMTWMHHVEHRLQDALPVPLYEPEPVSLQVRDHDGRSLSVRQYCFSAAARERRAFEQVQAGLEAAGDLLRARLGNSRLIIVPAARVLACAQALTDSGPGIYRAG